MEMDSLLARVNRIADAMQHPSDLLVRYLLNHDICLLYIGGIVDLQLCQESVVKPLLTFSPSSASLQNIIDSLAALNVGIKEDDGNIPQLLLNGSVILISRKHHQIIDIRLAKFAKRSIMEPEMEVTTRGPKDGFVEDLSANRSLIRKRLKTDQLRIESVTLGSYSHTPVEIYYIDGIADQELVKDIIRQIESMNVPFITDSSLIERALDRRKLKFLPIIQHTQRPDTVICNLMEGRIVILVDGTPDAILLPAVFLNFMESPDDYYEMPVFAAVVKLLRLFAFVLSITLPAIYLAISTYHWALIPTKLLISFASSRSGVPYPLILEILLLEFIFEVLREAGIRFPKNVGQVVSIVGALVIGEAAVQAGFVSAPTVIVVAFTGIASYIVPKYSFGTLTRLLRFPLLAVATFAGLPGLLMGFSVIAAHFINTTSFGKPYMSLTSKVHGKSTAAWFINSVQKKD